MFYASTIVNKRQTRIEIEVFEKISENDTRMKVSKTIAGRTKNRHRRPRRRRHRRLFALLSSLVVYAPSFTSLFSFFLRSLDTRIVSSLRSTRAVNPLFSIDFLHTLLLFYFYSVKHDHKTQKRIKDTDDSDEARKIIIAWIVDDYHRRSLRDYHRRAAGSAMEE